MERKNLVLILGIAFGAVAMGAALIAPRLGQSPSLQQPTVAQDEALAEQIKAYESKVGEEPENATYRAKLGELYFQRGDWDKAIGNLERAAELDPQNIDLQIKLAIVYWHSGDVEGAFEQLDGALRLDPSHITTRFYRGILLSAVNGKETEAIAELKKVIELDPDSELARRAQARLAELENPPSPAPSLLPKSLGGIPLKDYSSGEEALAEISRLHPNELPLADGYVGRYSDETRSATLWIAKSADPRELLQQMLKAIRGKQTPFSAPREVEGLEREVYRSEGMGQAHYIWVKENFLIWMALEGFLADEEVEFLKEALEVIG